MFCIFCVCYAFADNRFEYTYSGKTLTYEVTDEAKATCQVKNCDSKTSGRVVIPRQAINKGKRYTVTEIGEDAFYGCRITSVSIPNSVIKIRDVAFYYCHDLTSVTIPYSVKEIGINAFYRCSSLTSVTIPNSVTTIGGGAFCVCRKLRSIVIPNSVKNLGKAAFYECSGLTSVTIPNTLKTIEESTFGECESLTSVIIPASVTTIGKEAFEKCTKLASVKIPTSVTTIEEGAFKGCTGLKTLIIPNSVNTIGEKAFEGCSGLTSVKISNSVTTIEKGTFEDCSGLKNITIPGSVKTIESRAFAGCDGLTSVTFPDTAITIKPGAFEGCSGIKEGTIPYSFSEIVGRWEEGSEKAILIINEDRTGELNDYRGRLLVSIDNYDGETIMLSLPNAETIKLSVSGSNYIYSSYIDDDELDYYFHKVKGSEKQSAHSDLGNSAESATAPAPEQIFTAVEKSPKFPGGDKAMYSFLSENIVYPEAAAKNNIQGRVTVQFVVEKDGSIGEAQVVRGKDPDLDKEAVRVIKSMPKFFPGKINGQAVRCLNTLPISFKLQ